MKTGCSCKTVDKWRVFEHVLDGLINRMESRRGFGNQSRMFTYFDVYAGPGVYSESHPVVPSCIGSPIIAATLLKGLPHRLFLNDHDPDCVSLLQDALMRIATPANVACRDASDFLNLVCDRGWRESALDGTPCNAGLLFVDSNGVPDWKAVSRFTDVHDYAEVPVLLNVNAVAPKRLRRFDVPFLDESLALLRRRHMYVYYNRDKNKKQFALIYASNLPARFLEPIGFVSKVSQAGYDLLRELTFTGKERELVKVM